MYNSAIGCSSRDLNSRSAEFSFERGAHRQPGMFAVGVDGVGRFPGGDLDQGAFRVGAASPRETFAIDAASALLFVAPQEPVGESRADRTGRRPDWCGSTEGRVGEHQRCECEVVMEIGENGGGPVDQCPTSRDL